MFYCLVAGSRTYSNYAEFCVWMDRILSRQSEVTIVSGGARGADALAERYAKERGFKLVVFKADWKRYGRSAGYKRNVQMHRFIAHFEHRGCVCFWDGASRGTQHNFGLAEQFGTPIRVVRYREA